MSVLIIAAKKHHTDVSVENLKAIVIASAIISVPPSFKADLRLEIKNGTTVGMV